MRLKVTALYTAGLLSSLVPAFAQSPRIAPAAPMEFNFVLPPMPQMPPMPPMPEMRMVPSVVMPAMPLMSVLELGGLSALAGGSEDPEIRFRQEVFRTLLRNSPDRAIEIATDRLKADPADPVVIANLSGIANSGSVKAFPLLVSIAKNSTDSAARRAAVSAVVRNRDDKDAANVLQDIYKANSADVEVRRAVVSSLSRLTDPQTVSIMARIATNDPDATVRRTAIQYLGSRKDPDALKALEGLLKQGTKTPGF